MRGRRSGLAALAILGVVATAAALASGGIRAAGGVFAPDASTDADWRLVIRDGGGETLMAVDLRDGTFALRYRNSLYGSLAEERFSVTGDGQLELTSVAAEEPALLAEYYGVEAPKPTADGDTLPWAGRAAEPVALDQLSIAATRQGQRTLLVSGRAPVALWQLVADTAPTVTLTVEPSS